MHLSTAVQRAGHIRSTMCTAVRRVGHHWSHRINNVYCTQRSVRAESVGPGQSTGFPCPLQYMTVIMHMTVLSCIKDVAAMCASPLHAYTHALNEPYVTKVNTATF